MNTTILQTEDRRTGQLTARWMLAGVMLLLAVVYAWAASFTLTAAMRADYQRLWDTMQIRPARIGYVDTRVNRILLSRARYEAMSRETRVPWYLIAVIDELEGGGGCRTHLHNGDSLRRRTVHVPANRPRTHDGPFTWEESARDALQYDGLLTWSDWSVPGMLFKLEGFNGFGYRSHRPGRPIPTPYLWSFSTHYGPPNGKFTSDGVYDRRAVSDQVGAAVLMRRMVERRLITVPDVRP